MHICRSLASSAAAWRCSSAWTASRPAAAPPPTLPSHTIPAGVARNTALAMATAPAAVPLACSTAAPPSRRWSVSQGPGRPSLCRCPSGCSPPATSSACAARRVPWWLRQAGCMLVLRRFRCSKRVTRRPISNRQTVQSSNLKPSNRQIFCCTGRGAAAGGPAGNAAGAGGEAPPLPGRLARRCRRRRHGGAFRRATSLLGRAAPAHRRTILKAWHRFPGGGAGTARRPLPHVDAVTAASTCPISTLALRWHRSSDCASVLLTKAHFCIFRCHGE